MKFKRPYTQYHYTLSKSDFSKYTRKIDSENKQSIISAIIL